MQNRLDDLPVGLSDMNKLQILKIAGNPLRYPLRRVLEGAETDIASSGMTDNEKEVAVTSDLKLFLKSRQAATTPEPDFGADSRYVIFFPGERMVLNAVLAVRGLSKHPNLFPPSAN